MATARIFNEKKLEIIAFKDINTITRYVRGACSSFEMNNEFKLVIDSKAIDQGTIVMSFGAF